MKTHVCMHALHLISGCSYFLHRVDEALNVRIADFGLSRDVYESNYYVLRHSARLPVRWMALESLLDGRFNLTTDVVGQY